MYARFPNLRIIKTQFSPSLTPRPQWSTKVFQKPFLKSCSSGEETPKTTPLKKASLGMPVLPPNPTVKNEALYLYCVGDGAIGAIFGNIGIDKNAAYAIPYRGISAVVHKCTPEPYKSDNSEIVKEWVMTHQSVVDAAWGRFGTVLPLGFDTIIKGSEAVSAEENLKKWLEEDYETLKENLDRFRGKIEVGVQIFLNMKAIVQTLLETNEEIRNLNEEMKEKSPGMAYFHKQKMERAVKKELEKMADECFRDFYGKIKEYADDIRVEKTKRTAVDTQMIMNLSVLIQRGNVKLLGKELAKIEEKKGIDVRFTGPWPPYSFVTSA